MPLLKVALVKLGVSRTTTTGGANANPLRTGPLLASASCRHEPSPKRTAGTLLATFAMFATVVPAFADQTTPGTPISNTVTATYADSNSVTYNAASNTVTTVVQNSPSVTVSNPTGQNITASGVVLDSFSVSNSGNANGKYVIPSDATVGTGATLRGYVLPANFAYANGATTCTAAAPCNLATLNADLQAYTATAGGAPLVIGVEYKVAANASPGTTIASTFSAQITYAAAATTVNGTTYNVVSVTSGTSSGTETDTIAPNARIDISKTATPPTDANAPIVYSITANDGGAFPAHDLTSVKTVLGAATAGILITDKIPTFVNTTTGLNSVYLTQAPTATLNGASPGAQAFVYYTADATGASGWSQTYSANAAVVGVFITGGGGVELPSNPSGSNGAGSVSTPQVTISLSLHQPTGPGSGNPGALMNIANAEIGGNPNADGTTPIVGPGVPADTFDGTTNGNNATVTVVANTTPSSGATAPGGSSNQSPSQAFGLSGAYVGPVGFPQATGSYPAPPNNGLAGASATLDFTAVGFACANTSLAIGVGNNSTIPNTPGTVGCNVPAGGVAVPFTLQNVGNQSESYVVAALPPAGYSVTLYAAVCPVPPYLTLPTCTLGTQFAQSASVGQPASGTYPTLLTVNGAANQVPSGPTGTVSGVAVYTAVNPVAPFVVADSTITITGSRNSPTTPEADTTHVDLYPGGAVQVNKSQTIVSSNCGGTPAPPTGAMPGVCPGGVVQYTIGYKNVAPATLAAGGSGLGTEPAFALNGITVNGLVLSEDGFARIDGTTNGWGTSSFGAAQPTDTTTGTTFAPVAGYSTGTYPATTQGNTAFTAQIGGATTYKVQPGTSGTMVFSVTVK